MQYSRLQLWSREKIVSTKSTLDDVNFSTWLWSRDKIVSTKALKQLWSFRGTAQIFLSGIFFLSVPKGFYSVVLIKNFFSSFPLLSDATEIASVHPFSSLLLDAISTQYAFSTIPSCSRDESAKSAPILS